MIAEARYCTAVRTKMEERARIEEKLSEVRAQVLGYLEHWDAAREVAAQFPGVVRGTYDPVRITWGAGCLNGVLMTCADCADLRAVAPVVKALVERGYRLLGSDDYAAIRRRTWRFAARDDGRKATVIHLSAFLPEENGEGAACRVVEVDEVQKAYRIVCPDDELVSP